jgi:inosine-uridine nucleoside N-ribohydrolase
MATAVVVDRFSKRYNWDSQGSAFPTTNAVIVAVRLVPFVGVVMARKVLIDCDPGIDDAIALCLALFDERLDVVAITATEGKVPAEQSTRNVQAIVDTLDPPKYPRLGKAQPHEGAPPTSSRRFHGADGLGNVDLDISRLQHEHTSDKLICDVVRTDPEDITIICLGPLTNVARAIKRDAELHTMIGQLMIMGGSTNGIGNETAAAEFNIYYDPEAARTVFDSLSTKTVIPLDVTREVEFDVGLLDNIPPESCRAGAFLRGLLPHAFRAFRQNLGRETIHLHDVVALMATLHPELFSTEAMYGDVETLGDITCGATVFDRRPDSRVQPNMDVAIGIDAVAVKDGILRGLHHAGRHTL